MPFVTDFVRIAKSGPTIDGRTVEPEWLQDMADAYDPDVYTALIWPDHFRYGGNAGVVRELSTEKDGDTVFLCARLEPNEWLRGMNRAGQRLFTSMEITQDFAGTGRPYLSGLAVTDSPASLGTTELRFTADGQERFHGLQLEGPLPEFHDGAEAIMPGDDRALGRFFRRLFRLSGAHGEKPAAAPADSDSETQDTEETMDEKQFSELKDLLEAQTRKIEGLAEQFTAAGGGQTEPEAAGGTGDSGAEQDGSASFAAVPDEVVAELKGIRESFDAFTSRLESAVPGTAVPETVTPADAVIL